MKEERLCDFVSEQYYVQRTVTEETWIKLDEINA
jgi:hypothetical protein